MTSSSSSRGVGIRLFRSGIVVYLLLFLMLCSVALLLNAKTKDKEQDFHWMTSEEAFDPSHNGNPPDPNSIKKVVIDASYEEVFHAASNAATQAMWEIDKQDKTGGLLFAHRIVDEPWSKIIPQWGEGPPGKHQYFYRVKTNELSAKQTEVVLESKVQGNCRGCAAPLGLGRSHCKAVEQDCGELRAGMWLNANDQEEISQFVVLLRNNLIAAGGQ